jgi:hypothetical protein
VNFATVNREGQALDDWFFTDGNMEVFDFELAHGKGGIGYEKGGKMVGKISLRRSWTSHEK